MTELENDAYDIDVFITFQVLKLTPYWKDKMYKVNI